MLVLASACICESGAAPVTSLAFSPDGSILAAASGTHVTLYASTNRATVQSFSWEGERAVAVAFHPSGAWLAVGTGIPGELGNVRLLDLAKREWLSAGKFRPAHDVVTGVAFSPDGSKLAATSADKRVEVVGIGPDGLPSGPLFALTGHSAAVQAAAFSPDGRMIVTVSVDRSLKVWSADDGKLVRSLGHHTESVHALAFRPRLGDWAEVPPYCASGSDDRTVRLWQPGIGRMVRIVRGHAAPVLAVVFAQDGQTLYSAGQEGIVRQIDAESDEILGQWRASPDWIYSLAVSPDGRWLAAGDWRGTVHWQRTDAFLPDRPNPAP